MNGRLVQIKLMVEMRWARRERWPSRYVSLQVLSERETWRNHSVDFERRIDALGSEKQNLEVQQQASAHEIYGLLVRRRMLLLLRSVPDVCLVGQIATKPDREHRGFAAASGVSR